MDVELLRVEAWVGLDEDGFAAHLFHLLQPPGGGFELLDDLRVDAQHDIAAVEMLMHLAHLDVDVIADGDWGFDHASALADAAGSGQGALKRLLDALAGDGDEAEVIELENLGWGAITF